MNPLISICVPVYNVAPYIERCVRSLMEQTYENIEYIFVDDCSTDSSIEILQNSLAQYPDRSPHVHIIHNDRNHGLAYTRRVSIEAAQGDYIYCVDSDDYIEPTTIEHMVRAVRSKEHTMVIAGYMDERGTKKTMVPPPMIQPDEDLLLAVLEDRIFRLSGKLIQRSVFSLPSVHFAPEGMNYLEDRIVLLYVCGAIQSVCIVNEPLYHYVQHPQSVSNNKTDTHFACLVRYWQLTDSYLAEQALTARYQDLTDRKKIEDKIHLLHACDDMTICRKYATLFADAEVRHPDIRLSRGFRITRFLTKHKLWILLRFYKIFVHFF